MVRVTCVLYGVIVVKVDRGFLWEFRPNRFIKNNSQLKYSILISSRLFFLLEWSFSRSYAILAISGSPTSFQAVFIKNSCEYSRTPLTRTLKGNKKQLSGSIAKLHFQYESLMFQHLRQCIVLLQCKFNILSQTVHDYAFFVIKSDLFVAPIKIKSDAEVDDL